MAQQGMFGNQYEQAVTAEALAREEAANTQGMTGWAAITQGMSTMGSNLGYAAGSAFGGRTDAEVKQDNYQSILNSVPNFDPSSAESMNEMASAMWNGGEYDQGMQFYDRGQKMIVDNLTVESAKIKLDALKNPTVPIEFEELADGRKYLKSSLGQPDVEPILAGADIIVPEEKDDLLAFEKKLKIWNDATPEERESLKESGVFGSTGTNITFAGDDAYDKEGGKQFFLEDQKLIKQAKGANAQILKTNNVLRTINRGEANVGATSFFEQSFDRIASAFGSRDSEEAAADTQLLDALLGSDVFPMIGALGIGARGLDTPAERKFLQRVMTGEISMEGSALEQLTRLRQKYSTLLIQDYNTLVRNEDGSDRFARYEKLAGRKLQEIKIPKMVRPVDKVYNVSDGKDGTIEKTYPIMEQDTDKNSPTFNIIRWQYRPDGPYYDPNGIDITSMFESYEPTYVESN